MRPFRLTIQKKFGLLFLIVGLLPALVGVVMATWGSRLSFERAMVGGMETRASSIAERLGASVETFRDLLGRSVAVHGSDVDALVNDTSGSIALTAVARLRGEDFEVHALDRTRPFLADELTGRRGQFRRIAGNVPAGPRMLLGDIDLEEPGRPTGARLAYLATRTADGTALFFFVHGDELLREARPEISGRTEPVHLFSRKGYLLTTTTAPDGFEERAARELSDIAGAAPSFFRGREDRTGPMTWYVAGYSVVPRLSSWSSDARGASPWFVLSFYDMEDFIGEQAVVVWGTVFVALGWAVLLLIVSVIATRRVVGPVKALRYQAEAMTAGELNVRAKVNTRDEIRDLAEAFNTMADKLNASHRDLERRAEEAHQRAEHIGIINEVTKAVGQALDLDRIFEILKRDLGRVIDYDGLWIALSAQGDGGLEITHAEPADLMNSLRTGGTGLDPSINEKAVRDGEASHGDFRPEEDDSGASPSGIFRGLGFASYLVAPLPSVERTLGAITVVSSARDAYDDADASVLGSVAGAVAVGIELTELFERTKSFTSELEHKVEERTSDLAQANKKLVQTEKYAATGRLAANLAHEINNPLGIIKNYLKIVTTKLETSSGGRRQTDPNADQMRIINEEIDRIARIVRQLLDLHRPPEQKASRTDITALISDILALMEKDLAAGGIEVRCEMQPEMAQPMVAPDLIRQVLINLIRNAQDAMDEGGALTITTESKMQYEGSDYERVVVISIADTGCGIAAEEIEHIFDPFFTTKPADKGTGLGLSVSYGIIQMYHGLMEAVSEPGKGTTMIVTLPVEQPKPADQILESADDGARREEPSPASP